MGGDHHGHGSTYKVPKDHTIYKVNEKYPTLINLEKRLAKEGLKDPWIRNEISRFHMDHIPLRTKLYMSLGGRYMLIGMGIGTAAAVVQWVYDSQFDHHGGHHGDHHGNHHGEH